MANTTTTGTGTGTSTAPTIAQLQAAMAALQAQCQQQQGTIASLQSAATSRPGTLGTWQGHSCTSLIRAMAMLGWAPGTVTRVMVQLGLQAAGLATTAPQLATLLSFVPAPHTVTTQRQHAKAGKAGAVLTTAQQAHLLGMLGNGLQAPTGQAIAPTAVTK